MMSPEAKIRPEEQPFDYLMGVPGNLESCQTFNGVFIHTLRVPGKEWDLLLERFYVDKGPRGVDVAVVHKETGQAVESFYCQKEGLVVIAVWTDHVIPEINPLRHGLIAEDRGRIAFNQSVAVAKFVNSQITSDNSERED